MFPNNFKYAEVRPVFKKGDALDVQNYRPISVLISCSKVVEAIMCDQMMAYLSSVSYLLCYVCTGKSTLVLMYYFTQLNNGNKLWTQTMLWEIY